MTPDFPRSYIFSKSKFKNKNIFQVVAWIIVLSIRVMEKRLFFILDYSTTFWKGKGLRRLFVTTLRTCMKLSWWVIVTLHAEDRCRPCHHNHYFPVISSSQSHHCPWLYKQLLDIDIHDMNMTRPSTLQSWCSCWWHHTQWHSDVQLYHWWHG